MSLTRKMLKAMQIEEEKIDQIIEAHSETVDALKKDRDTYKEDASKLKDVQKELDDLKAKGDDGWKEKHDKVKKEYEEYKSDIESKQTKEAKEKAARAYFESVGITGKNLEIAIRGSRSEIDGLEMDGEKIKDTASLKALVDGDFASLVATTTTKGAKTSNPPANGGKGTDKTKEEIMAIKDGAVRRQEMLNNPHLFGLENK